MTKKILIGLGIAVLALVSFYFYQRFTFEQQINRKLENLSEQQKNQVQGFINTNINPNLNNQEVKNIVVDSVKEAGDKIIQSEMRNLFSSTKGYFALHENYGTSSSNNICSSYDFLSAIKTIDKNSFIPASCVVNNSFPAKSFTVTVPYTTGNYKIYCADQNGFAGIVDDSNLKEGVKCK